MQLLRNRLIEAAFAGIVALALPADAYAQISSAQQSALRANCRSDFMSKCSGVTPGGKDALACLQKNVETLSAACKSAVSATMPAPAPAAAAPPPAPAPAPATEAAAPPPAPAPAAAAAPVAPAAPMAPAPTAAAPATPKPPQAPKPTVAAKPAAPTAAQQNAMRSACRSDFMSKCSGVAPGGKDALACLQRNVSTLSPGCKNVVSATIAAPPAAAAVAAPAAVDAAPSITPEQMGAVKFTCRSDFGRYCKGVAPGGPEALGCLKSNAARLTPDCKTSLAAIADEVPAATTAATAATPAAAAHRPRLPGITPAGRVLKRVMERVEEKQQQQ